MLHPASIIPVFHLVILQISNHVIKMVDELSNIHVLCSFVRQNRFSYAEIIIIIICPLARGEFSAKVTISLIQHDLFLVACSVSGLILYVHSLMSPLAVPFNNAFHDNLPGAVILCDVATPRRLKWQRFVSAHETVNPAPYIVIGFVFLVDGEELSQAFFFSNA